MGTVELSVFPGQVAAFTISLHVPTWCSRFDVHIDDEIYKGQAGKYLDLARRWKDGDIIRICMNMDIQQRSIQDSLVLARGPQILASLADLKPSLDLSTGWKGNQLYSLIVNRKGKNEKLALAPYADACLLGKTPVIIQNDIGLIEELPSDALEELRSQLEAFRDEFGGANDMPDVKFFLFGMGNRTKFIYRDGILRNALTGTHFQTWQIARQTIVPNEYRVELLTLKGDSITIFEDEGGVFVKEGELLPILIEGTGQALKLPQFQQYRYSQVLKVLHHEILINIVDSRPLPNFLVYPKPWRRDAAMMAMCLEKTGNLELIKDWVLNLDTPYDYNNKVDGTPEEEPDNLGQTLYLLSLFSDKEHPLVSKIHLGIQKYEKNWLGKKYIKGRTDMSEYPAYQTKWLKFGLKEIGLDDPYRIPDVNDSYSPIFWWDFKAPSKDEEDPVVWLYYPYLSWAKDHYFGTKRSPISNRDYPLTWEIEASQADYEKMKIIDNFYYLEKNASPHTWHTAEVFLYLID